MCGFGWRYIVKQKTPNQMQEAQDQIQGLFERYPLITSIEFFSKGIALRIYNKIDSIEFYDLAELMEYLEKTEL